MAPVKSPELPLRRTKSPSNSARDSKMRLRLMGTKSTGETIETSVGSPESQVGTNAAPPDKTGMGLASSAAARRSAFSCAVPSGVNLMQTAITKHNLVSARVIRWELFSGNKHGFL